jgi:hypothetical protein
MISPTLASFSADIPSASGVEVGSSAALAGTRAAIHRVNNVNDDRRTNRFIATLPSVNRTAAAILTSRHGANSYGHNIGAVAADIAAVTESQCWLAQQCSEWGCAIIQSRGQI